MLITVKENIVTLKPQNDIDIFNAGVIFANIGTMGTGVTMHYPPGTNDKVDTVEFPVSMLINVLLSYQPK